MQARNFRRANQHGWWPAARDPNLALALALALALNLNLNLNLFPFGRRNHLARK